MADYDIAAVTRRAVYTGSAGTGPYAFSFACLETSDIAVYKDTTLLTETSDYTVTLSPTTGTGSITLAVAANSGNTITLVGARDLARTTDFVTAGSLTASALNTDFDSLVIFAQQLSEENSRNLKAPVTEGISGSTDMTLPAKADRLGKYLAFNETTGNPEAGPDQTDVVTLAAITSDIAVLADIEDGTDATDAIQTVAGISANVTTVAGVSSNVTTVAGISADVTSVAGDATDIGTVATNIASVNTVATNIADVVTVANDLNEAISEIETAANDLNEATSEIDTVATSISNVDTVGTNIANVNTVAGISANVTTVAGISANTTTVAGIASDVTTVAGISADTTTVAGIDSDVTTVSGISGNVTTVAGISANVTTVAGVSANVTTVATDIANVNTTATNIAGVNSFAERYRVGSSDPVASLDEGDLFYNSTDNEVKYYNGSAWASITAGIANIVEDTTPQLGGDLASNGNDVLFADSDKAIFGAGSDLQIYHDGSNSYIKESGDGVLFIQGAAQVQIEGAAAGENMAVFTENGSCQLMYDNAEKLATTATGVDVTGGITTSGAVDVNGNELILDADADTSITADTDDRIDLRVGGADRAYITNNTIGGIINRQNAKPIIYNGDMQITQRATSKTGITGTTMEVQDRWSVVMGGAGTWTQSSDTDVPTGQGFTKSMKWDCTTARSLVAGSIFYIRQTIEGQDLQLLKYGTSNAEKLTLSFWLKSPKTGTHIVQLYGADDNRSVSKAYTVSSANTWEKHTISFPADTTGVIDNDNGYGMGIQLWFLAGTTYSSGTLNTTWNTYANADAGVGQVDCADSTSNNILLTGVQLEVGEYDATTIPPFQHEALQDNFFRCQRYYQNQGNNFYGMTEGTNFFRLQVPFDRPMRTSPSITARGVGFKFNARYLGDYTQDNPSIASGASTKAGCWLGVSGTGLAGNTPIYGRSQQDDAGQFLALSAEI